MGGAYPKCSTFPRLLGGVYPGLNGVAVTFEPGFHALDGVPGLVDVGLHLVDLLLVERDSVEERVGYGVVALEVLVDYGGDLGRLVEGAQEVFRVLKVAKVIPEVHPVRRPRVEHEGLPLSISV